MFRNNIKIAFRILKRHKGYSFITIASTPGRQDLLEQWGRSSYYNYVELIPGTDPKSLNERLAEYSPRFRGRDPAKYILQPLSNLHWEPISANITGMITNDKKNLYLFSVTIRFSQSPDRNTFPLNAITSTTSNTRMRLVKEKFYRGFRINILFDRTPYEGNCHPESAGGLGQEHSGSSIEGIYPIGDLVQSSRLAILLLLH